MTSIFVKQLAFHHFASQFRSNLGRGITIASMLIAISVGSSANAQVAKAPRTKSEQSTGLVPSYKMSSEPSSVKSRSSGIRSKINGRYNTSANSNSPFPTLLQATQGRRFSSLRVQPAAVPATGPTPSGAVFSDATPYNPGVPGGYTVGLSTSATCLGLMDSTVYNSSTSNQATAYNDDANTIVAYTNNESASISQAYSGPYPGDSTPGLLKEISIISSHQATDTLTMYAATLTNPPYQGPASTTNAYVQQHLVTISNQDSPTASLLGKTLTINFTSSVSDRKVGFNRGPTLQLNSTFLNLDINTQGGDDTAPAGGPGLLAYGGGKIIAQDFNYASPAGTAAATTQFTYQVALPDTHSIPFTFGSVATLGSGPGTGEVHTFEAGTTETQLPSFNWSISFQLND